MSTAVASGIRDFVQRNGVTSFIELCNRVPGVRGDRVFMHPNNLCIWHALSSEAIDALMVLMHGDKIHMESTKSSFWIYTHDGGPVPGLPIAKNKHRKYSELHWLPTVIKPGPFP